MKNFKNTKQTGLIETGSELKTVQTDFQKNVENTGGAQSKIDLSICMNLQMGKEVNSYSSYFKCKVVK